VYHISGRLRYILKNLGGVVDMEKYRDIYWCQKTLRDSSHRKQHRFFVIAEVKHTYSDCLVENKRK